MQDEELRLLDREGKVGLSKWCDQYLAAEHLRSEALRLTLLAQGGLRKKLHAFTEMVAHGMKSRAQVPDYKDDYVVFKLERDFMRAGIAFPKGTRCRQQSSDGGDA